MKKKLLIGPAGSGKTEAVLNDFENCLRESGDPLADDYFLILPSHEHAQRMLSVILQRGSAGFFQRRITTLNTLFMEVFGVSNEGVAGNVTRFLIMRDIFAHRTWEVFASVQQTSGFLNCMLAFIAELKESLIALSDFRKHLEPLKKLEPELAPKYQALIEIYQAYEEELEKRGLRDRSDNLAVLKKLSEEGRLPRRRFRKIWLDGFFDFSELQLAYLDLLGEAADEIIVTLALDPAEERSALFETAHATRRILEARGFESQYLTPYEGRNPVLDALERRVFLPEQTEEALAPAREVTLYEAVGMEGEVEMIARTIVHMERSFGFRFSDFAILLRQIGEYEQIIQSVFGRYGIPVEIHERERLRDSPLIQTVCSLLEIFLKDWPAESLMRFLKSNYVRRLGDGPKDYYWVNQLEHAAMKHGIYKGREAWLTEWCSDGSGKGTAFDREKEARLGPLAALEKKLRQAADFTALRTALITAVRSQFEIFHFEQSGEEYVRRDVAAFKRLTAILDELETSFTRQLPEEGIDFESFCDRFFRLVDLDLYSLHHRNTNRVQVYNVSLARQKQYEVVFVAGLLEKKFPVQVREDPVLSDWERNLFNGSRAGARLKERLPSQSLERYLFYIAITRARHKLILSYPRMDLEGRSSLPSSYIFEVKKLFSPRIASREQFLSRPYPAVEDAVNQRELELGLAGELWHGMDLDGERRNQLLGLVQLCRQNPESLERFRRTGYQVRNELDDAAIDLASAFRTHLTSPSALEDYAKCHFKYFARRVLKLEDPAEDQNVTARGTILHEVLELCFQDWQNRPGIYGKPDLAVKEALAKLREVMQKYPLILERPYQYELERFAFEEQLTRFLEAELKRLLDAPLKPRFFELGFGDDGAEYPPLVIEDESGPIRIRGKIDRIDLDEKGQVGLVLDYKRSAVFKAAALGHGTALQLPIYILVLTDLLKIQPAGAELYSIRECKNNGFYHGGRTDYFPGLSKRRLILPEAAFDGMIARSVNFIRKFMREMRAGDIRVEPRACDSFCPYAPVCRIEKWKLPLIEKAVFARDPEDPLLQGGMEISAAAEEEAE